MAYQGQVLDNPVSGERFIFAKTADDTGGELLAVELVLEPDGRVPGGHVHPVQEERFDVISGTMEFRKGLKRVRATSGDTVVVPPGTFHRFANAGDEQAIVRVQVQPALRMEWLYETAVELARDGRTLPSGLPKPLDLALFMREFESEVGAPFAPGLVRTVMTPLAWLAARRGHDGRYRALAARRLAARRPAGARPGEGKAAGSRPPSARPPATPRSSTRPSSGPPHWGPPHSGRPHSGPPHSGPSPRYGAGRGV